MIDVRLELKPLNEIQKNHGLQKGGPVQAMVDSECNRWMEKYTPMRTGTLIKAATIGTVIGSGEIRQETPYAHYMYEGIVYVDPKTGKAGFLNAEGMWKSRKNVTKVPSDRQLTYYGGGLRGKRWFDRMKADHKEDIRQAAAAAIRKAEGR